jgi:4-amino-4-deoxy-L-arabinose transferase-like glycosyltransferase
MPLFESMRPQPFRRIIELLDPTRLPLSSLLAASVFLWLILTLSGLGIAPLFDYDETAHAQTAVEMPRDGKWLLPTMNSRPFYEKPAFLFYFMSASFALFGENAFAARLPSALFTLVTALYLYYVGRRIGRSLAGMTAALIYLSMLMPALLAHAAILDAALNFWIAVSVMSFFLWRQSGQLATLFFPCLPQGLR